MQDVAHALGRGMLLVAAPPLADGNFDRTVVLLLEHSREGALGLVLNRPSPVAVADTLPGWEVVVAEPAVLFAGGPVQGDTALALGVGDPVDAAPGWSQVVGVVGTVDLHQGPEAAGIGPVRLYAGYAGWGPGQLEGELRAGAWVVVPAVAEDVFGDPDDRWRAVLRRQGGRTAWLANAPMDPTVN